MQAKKSKVNKQDGHRGHHLKPYTKLPPANTSQPSPAVPKLISSSLYCGRCASRYSSSPPTRQLKIEPHKDSDNAFVFVWSWIQAHCDYECYLEGWIPTLKTVDQAMIDDVEYVEGKWKKRYEEHVDALAAWKHMWCYETEYLYNAFSRLRSGIEGQRSVGLAGRVSMGEKSRTFKDIRHFRTTSLTAEYRVPF